MAVPVALPPLDPKHFNTETATNWFQSIRSPAGTVPAPRTAKATGIPGQIAYDANYLYVCVGENEWRRIAHSSF